MTDESRMRDALSLIAGIGCEHFNGSASCVEDRPKGRGARYGADAWCSACIASDALGRPASKEAVRRAVKDGDFGLHALVQATLYKEEAECLVNRAEILKRMYVWKQQ